MQVLATAVHLLDPGGALPVAFQVQGLTDQQVIQSVRRLDRATPSYWTSSGVAGALYPLVLAATAEQVPDPEKAGMLRRAAALLGWAVRDVAVGVATTQLGSL